MQSHNICLDDALKAEKATPSLSIHGLTGKFGPNWSGTTNGAYLDPSDAQIGASGLATATPEASQLFWGGGGGRKTETAGIKCPVFPDGCDNVIEAEKNLRLSLLLLPGQGQQSFLSYTALVTNRSLCNGLVCSGNSPYLSTFGLLHGPLNESVLFRLPVLCCHRSYLSLCATLGSAGGGERIVS